MSEAFLRKLHLVTALFQADGKSIVSASVRPLAWRMIYRPSNVKNALYFTDAMGCVRSLRADFEPLPAHVALGKSFPMHLLPKDLVPIAHFRHGQQWQGELMKQILALGLKQPEQPQIKTFQAADFDKANLDEKASTYFEKQKTIQCAVLPRLRSVCLVIDKNLLPNFIPQSNANKDSESAATLLCSGKFFELFCRDIGADMGQQILAVTNPIDSAIPEGLAQFSFKDVNQRNIYQGHVVIRFSTSSTVGDFSIHRLASNSLEETMLRTFASRYAHLNRLFYEEPESKTDDKNEAPPQLIQTLKSRVKLAQKVAKTSQGLINADDDKVFGLIFSTQWALFNEGFDDKFPLVPVIRDTWSAYKYIAEFPKQWKELHTKLDIAEKVAANYKVMSQAIDAGFLARVYRTTAMQRFAIDSLADTGAGKAKHFTARLASAKLKPFEAEMIMAIGVEKKVTQLDQLFDGKGKFATKSIAGLNIAMDAESLYSAWKEVGDVCKQEALAKDRFADACANYRKKFGTGWNFEAEKVLETFRQALDAHSQDLDEKQREALAVTFEMLLNLSVFVPVVGEIAGMILLVKEGVEVAVSAGQSLGGLIDRKWFQSFFADYFATQSRANALWEMGWVNTRALLVRRRGKSDAELKDDVEFQFRLRLHVLIGLLELIDRCGTRFEAAGKQAGSFDRKVKEYAIADYVRLFILEAKSDIPLQFGISMGQSWMLCRGNKVEKWHHIYTSKGFLKNGYRLHYQDSFPIHKRETKSTEDLARTFCVNYSGARKVGKMNLHIQTLVGEKWQSLSGSIQNPAVIKPTQPLRCLIEFTGEGDFSGLPVSLQCVRTDTFPDTKGPIYKGYFVSFETFERLDTNAMNATQKSTLETEPKSGRKSFVCDLRLFYFFRNELRQGIKPFGFIPIRANPLMEMEFTLKVGDTVFESGDFTMSPPRLQVSLPWNDPECADFILDRKFLQNKTSENRHDQLFINHLKPPTLLGLWVNTGNGFQAVPKPVGKSDFQADLSRSFSWTKPFSMLLLVGARYVTTHYDARRPAKVPGRIHVKELTGLDTAGPDFDIEIVELHRNQLKSLQSFSGQFTHAMRSARPDSPLLSANETLPIISVSESEPQHLFAIRLDAKYQVENDDNEFVTFDGFKPFGESYLDSGSYRYGFSLSTPEPIGLKIDDFFEMEVPGLNDSATKSRSFLNKKFVTNSVLAKELQIPKSGFR
jgi:hypothetical protein